MTILLMALHIVAAVCMITARRRGVMHFSSAMFPIVLLLPLWGPVCALAAELHILATHGCADVRVFEIRLY